MERKTMGRIMIAVAMVMTALMAGCGGAGSTLERAEAVIDSMPDSALALLSTLDVTRLDGGDKAWYALLQSKALDKSYIDVSDDSLIVQAVRYYDGEGSDHEMQAHYYRGVVIKNGGDARAAIVEFRKAEHLAAALHNDLYYAKSNEMLADIYYRSYNMERSIMHRMCAIDGYRKVDRHLNEQYAIVELASSYGNWHKNERCVAILDSLDDIGLYNDSIFKAFFYESYIMPYLAMREYDKAVEKIDKMFEYRSQEIVNITDFALISKVYYGLGDMDKYLYYHNLAKHQPRAEIDVIIYKNEFFMAKEKGQYELAIEKLQKVLHIVDSISCVTLQQSTALADRDFSEKLYMDELEAHNKDRLIFTLIVIALVMLVICIILLYRQKAARHRMQLESLIYEFKHQQTQLKDDVYTLFKERFLAIDKIGTEYFTGKDSDKMRSIMLKNIETELMSIVSPQSMSQLRNMINLLLDGVIDRMEAQLTFVKEQDIDFICLLAAGFSMKSIALLMNMTQSNCYSKRRRLKEKISQSGAADAEEFLRILG
ncbi:MAG: hypothetical protein ACI306_02315 [Muribaculaceae bacterium]